MGECSALKRCIAFPIDRGCCIGIQMLPFNTLFQLYAHQQMQPGELDHAHRMLLIPDLLHSWLCGALTTERTNATTTQCWDPLAGAWASDLLDHLEIPTSMLPP